MFRIVSVLVWLLLLIANLQAEQEVLRVGHFPNLTHAPALLAHGRWRQDPQGFEKSLGNNVKLEWSSYNAGPSAMEALLIGAIDMAYVGPNPAINAYQRSKGQEVRVLAGATFGGAALVVRPSAGLEKPQDFRGKKIGTPQLGNTQDVAARFWLLQSGLIVTQTGGDAFVLPAENPELLALFAAGKLDGVWTVEPWVSRLESEAGGRVLINESNALTTVLVCSVKALREKPQLLQAFVKKHKELVEELNLGAAGLKSEVAAELKAETLREVSPQLIASAWPRMHFSSEVTKEQFADLVASAQKVGFLKDVRDISELMHEQ